MTCSKLWGEDKNKECVKFCAKKINHNANKTNTKAIEILNDFITKNIKKIYLKKKSINLFFKESRCNQTLDEKINKAQKIIQEEKTNLLKLEANLLKLQQIKTLKIQKKLKIK